MTRHLAKIADVRLRQADVSEVALARCELGSIEDVAYVRKASRVWSDWAAANSQAASTFNWVSILNFGAGPGFESYSLHNVDTEALMSLRYGHLVRCDARHRGPLVYIAFLEVAPWNRSATPDRRFRGLGQVMLRAACDFSMQRGFGGRVGLHSVAQAEAFYRRVGFQGLDCPNEYNEMYFELDDGGVRALLVDEETSK